MIAAGPLLSVEQLLDLNYIGSFPAPEIYREYRGYAYLLLEPWQRWDTLWYVKIATLGYDPDDGSSVSLPLYPMAVRTLHALLGGDGLAMALLISNVAALGSFALFFALARQIGGIDYARRVLLCVVSFPTAFFLLAGYTESVFLLCVLFSFFCAHRKSWGWSILGACAATWTRHVGIALWPALMVLYWKAHYPRIRVRRFALGVLGLSAIPATLIAHKLLRLGIIDARPLTLVYEQNWDSRAVFPWVALVHSLRLLPKSLSLYGLPNVVDLVVAVALTAMIPLLWRRFGAAYGVFALVSMAMNLARLHIYQPLMGMSRFALTVFPTFLFLGQIAKRPAWNRLILYSGWLLQAHYVIRFVTWGFVA